MAIFSPEEFHMLLVTANDKKIGNEAHYKIFSLRTILDYQLNFNCYVSDINVLVEFQNKNWLKDR